MQLALLFDVAEVILSSVFNNEQSPPPAVRDMQSDRAVYIDQVEDIAVARQLLDQVLAVAALIDLQEIPVWAGADTLPLLAVAAAGIRDLPDGFQLRQVADRPAVSVGGGLTWLSRDLLPHPAPIA